jgi:hypothetical protein
VDAKKGWVHNTGKKGSGQGQAKLIRQLYHVRYESAGHRAETLSGTGPHPFFVVGKNAFVPADELAIGDEFRLADGSSAWITRIEVEDAPAGERFTTYNFTVEDDHTYHVGHLGVWVHNTGSKFCGEVLSDIHTLVFKDDDELREYILKRIVENGGSPAEQKAHLYQIFDAINRDRRMLRQEPLRFIDEDPFRRVKPLVGDDGLTERFRRWPWFGQHEKEIHHLLMKGAKYWDFWKKRGFTRDEVKQFVAGIDKDIHGAITDSKWWEHELFGRILDAELKNDGEFLEKEEIYKIAREVLDDINHWGRPGTSQ